ncbi:MAG TPA: T3SS effector HopA1 family protein, partial [Chloroflexia bacterium]|nr:T3SS effector HopA1 family protein [Chloroflexia bacterium]
MRSRQAHVHRAENSLAPDYREQVGMVGRALRFRSGFNYYWFGAPACPYSQAQLRRLPEKLARSYVLDSLASHLYAYFYCPGRACSERGSYSNALPDTAFVDQLSAANCGRGYWDDGWEVIVEHPEKLRVRKGGLMMWARPAEYRRSVLDGESADTVRLRFPGEQRAISPGFYMAFGDLPLPSNEPTLRVYWNIMPEGAADLMASLTELMNGSGYPFRLKVLTDQRDLTRCDRAVLYMKQADWEPLRVDLERVRAGCAHLMRDGVPSLTLPVGRGVAIAEDPGDGESFGQLVSRLVAGGFLSAYELGAHSLGDRLDVVKGQFTMHNLNFERPYLSPGSAYTYELLPARTPTRSQFRIIVSTPVLPAVSYSASEGLDAALQIGRQLAHSAVWHAGICNWVAPMPGTIEPTTANLNVGARISALGPDLYRGTAGVALFLGELGAITGDETLRRTALGGIDQALSKAELIEKGNRTGLYTGWFGIINAARRLAFLLDEGRLERQARLLIDHLLEATEASEHDLLSGSAGMVLSLVQLARSTGDPSLLEAAEVWGDRLVAAGIAIERGL